MASSSLSHSMTSPVHLSSLSGRMLQGLHFRPSGTANAVELNASRSSSLTDAPGHCGLEVGFLSIDPLGCGPRRSTFPPESSMEENLFRPQRQFSWRNSTSPSPRQTRQVPPSFGPNPINSARDAPLDAVRVNEGQNGIDMPRTDIEQVLAEQKWSLANQTNRRRVLNWYLSIRTDAWPSSVRTTRPITTSWRGQAPPKRAGQLTKSSTRCPIGNAPSVVKRIPPLLALRVLPAPCTASDLWCVSL